MATLATKDVAAAVGPPGPPHGDDLPPGLLGPCDFDADLGPAINWVSWVLIVVSLVFLLLRLYCKKIKNRGLWWDDWLLILSWLLYLGAAIVGSVNVHHGFGMHVCKIAATNPQNLPIVSLLSQTSGVLCIMATIWSKTSFAVTLLRIAETRWMRVTIWILVVILNVTVTIAAVITIVQCNPVQKSWDVFVPGYCWRQVTTDYSIASAIGSGVIDITLALLPWSIILKLKMRLVEKIGIAVAMSAGILAGISAFVKASHMQVLAKGDFSHDSFQLVVWTAAEMALTIAAACIPVLRVLIFDGREGFWRYYHSDRSGDASNGCRNSKVTIPSKGRKSEAGSQRGTLAGEPQQPQQPQKPQKQSNQMSAQEHELVPLPRPSRPPHSKSLSFTKPANAARSSATIGDDWTQSHVIHSDSEEGLIPRSGVIHTTRKFIVEYEPGPDPPDPSWPLRAHGIPGETRGHQRVTSVTGMR